MIGVAVILAAVAFGSFAGIGGESLSDPPNAAFEVTFDQGSVGGFSSSTDDDGANESVVITHESGDAVDWLYFHVYVDGTRVSSSPDLHFDAKPLELTAGEEVRVTSTPSPALLTPGTEIRVTYENPNTEDTLVLVEATIP